MLSRLHLILPYSRVAKLLPIKRYQSNYSVDNSDLLKARKMKEEADAAAAAAAAAAKAAKQTEEPMEVTELETEDMDLKHDRRMLTKDAKIDTVDIDGKKIEPININPWYEEEDEMHEIAKNSKVEADEAQANPAAPTMTQTE